MSHACPCPCESGLSFEKCCAPLLRGESHAATALQLMRSRYSAYTRRNTDYLLQTWHHSTRPPQMDLGKEPLKWLGLRIIAVRQGGVDDMEGGVEFVARYKVNGKAGRLHESSRFVKEDGCWFYVTADGT